MNFGEGEALLRVGTCIYYILNKAFPRQGYCTRTDSGSKCNIKWSVQCKWRFLASRVRTRTRSEKINRRVPSTDCVKVPSIPILHSKIHREKKILQDLFSPQEIRGSRHASSVRSCSRDCQLSIGQAAVESLLDIEQETV